MSTFKSTFWKTLSITIIAVGILSVRNDNDWGWALITVGLAFSFWRGWVEYDPRR